MVETTYEKVNKVYEGKAKVLYTTGHYDFLIQHFKDDATAFNNLKKGTISNKGILNNYISEYLMVALGEMNIPTHLIKRLDDREQAIYRANIIPVEVIVRNVAAGSITKRLGIKEGTKLDNALIEFYYKCDELNDPFINDDQIINFGWATADDLEQMRAYTRKINNFLQGLFFGVGIRLIDFKIEFGLASKNSQLILADEISPDSCRLWDIETNQKLDKDRFREDLGNIPEAYHEIVKRLGIKIPNLQE